MLEPAWKNNQYASYRVVNVVRERISTEYVTASDTDVAKALKVSRATISAYKYGRDRMSAETLARAQKLAQLEDAELVDLLFDMVIEEALEAKDVGFFIEAKQRVKKLMKGMSRTVASILLGAVAVLGLASLPAQRVAAAPSEGGTPGMYIKLTRGWMFRRWLLRWLGTPIPGRIVTAPAF